MTFCDRVVWRGGTMLAAVIIGLLVTACLSYMAGYYDGYHAGAVIYMESLP